MLSNVNCPRLPKYSDPRNLVRFWQPSHTRFTYHRTWETGLETEIRVADFNPAFFCPSETSETNPQTLEPRQKPKVSPMVERC